MPPQRRVILTSIAASSSSLSQPLRDAESIERAIRSALDSAAENMRLYGIPRNSRGEPRANVRAFGAQDTDELLELVTQLKDVAQRVERDVHELKRVMDATAAEAERERQEHAKRQRERFYPVEVNPNTAAYREALSRVSERDRKGRAQPTVWKCSGATGADGVCHHGLRPFRPTYVKGNVLTHIQNTHLQDAERMRAYKHSRREFGDWLV